jgi:hypothetical protein
MMDLKEATASIDFYTHQLDLACAQYRLGVAEKGKIKGSVAECLDLIKSAVADLNRLQREGLILRILIDRASGTEADRLLYVVDDLVTLLNAKERNALAFNRATELLCEHQKKLAEERDKAEAEDKTPVQLAIDDYFRREAAKKAANKATALPPSEEFQRKYPGRNIRTQGEP